VAFQGFVKVLDLEDGALNPARSMSVTMRILGYSLLCTCRRFLYGCHLFPCLRTLPALLSRSFGWFVRRLSCMSLRLQSILLVGALRRVPKVVERREAHPSPRRGSHAHRGQQGHTVHLSENLGPEAQEQSGYAPPLFFHQT